MRTSVCTCAVRNCLECRHRQQMQRLSMTPGQQGLADRPDPIQALITGAQPSSKVGLPPADPTSGDAAVVVYYSISCVVVHRNLVATQFSRSVLKSVL